MTPTPPNSIVWATPPTTSPAIHASGTPATRIGWECWWVQGPVTFPDLASPPSIVTLAPGGTSAKPNRLRSVVEPPTKTPLELAIAEQHATLARLWSELAAANARLIELQARLEAGETEPE